MDQVIAFILYNIGILTLFAGFLILKQEKSAGKTYVIYSLAAFFSAVWSISFGFLCIQTSENAARVCRSIGMIGVFFFFCAITELLVHFFESARILKIYVRAFSRTGILLWPFIIGRNSVEFIETWFGMSYKFSQNIFNTLYNIYCVIVGINIFIILIYMLKQAKRTKFKVIVKNLMVCCVVVMIGMIFDTFLPVFGFEAIPTSTITQGIGVLMIARVLKFQKTSEITVENFSEFVYYSVDTPVLIFDEDWHFRLGNNGMAEFFGDIWIKLDQKSITDIFFVNRESIEFEEKRKSIEAECALNNRFCQLGINKIYDEYRDIIGYIVVINDLTQKRDFIEKLQESEQRAEAANRAKSNFMARMSHEIRTPINGIIGMNEMILEKSSEDMIKNYAQMVKVSAHNLVELVNDILDISKIETNHMVVENVVYRFDELVQELWVMFCVRAAKKSLKFSIDIQNPMHVSLNGDEKKFRQIAMNVIGNAVKYTKEGSIIVEIDRLYDNNQYYVSFVVKDTGIGIKNENIEKIFDAFERVDNKKNEGIEGTGLGLSIVKSLVEIMDGSIAVESEYGKGSKFSILIPQEPIGTETFENVEPVVEEKNDSDIQQLNINISGKRILVVDDNEINRIVAGELFTYTGGAVETVESGKQCLELVQKNRYDFILLDHLMPEMDGIEVLKELKQMKNNMSRDAVCIVLTANAIQGAREEYIAEGFDDYLSKPIDILEVEKVLKKYC